MLQNVVLPIVNGEDSLLHQLNRLQHQGLEQLRQARHRSVLVAKQSLLFRPESPVAMELVSANTTPVPDVLDPGLLLMEDIDLLHQGAEDIVETGQAQFCRQVLYNVQHLHVIQHGLIMLRNNIKFSLKIQNQKLNQMN
jgi:hypothetical protein